MSVPLRARGSPRIPALQLFCNNVPDKGVRSRHCCLQSEPFQWESYGLKFSPRFLVLCLTHILIGIFLREKVFFSVSLKVLSVSIAYLTSSSRGRRFEVHWLIIGWGCCFSNSEWSNPTRFTMGSRAHMSSSIWSTNTHGVPARGWHLSRGCGYAVVTKDSSIPAFTWLYIVLGN